MDGLVYGLTDPRTGTIRYVGKSTTGLQRPRQHGNARHLSKPSHKTSWIKGLRAEGLDYGIEVLALAEVAELYDEERGWIAIGKTEGWPLTNLSDGGAGMTGCRHSPETRARMAESSRRATTPDRIAALVARNKAREWTPDQRQRASQATTRLRTGSHHSEETKRRISAGNKGKRVGVIASAETRAKMSAAHIGRRRSPETRARMSVAAVAREAARRLRRLQ